MDVDGQRGEGVETWVLPFDKWATWMLAAPPSAPDKAYSERLQVCFCVMWWMCLFGVWGNVS